MDIRSTVRTPLGNIQTRMRTPSTVAAKAKRRSITIANQAEAKRSRLDGAGTQSVARSAVSALPSSAMTGRATSVHPRARSPALPTIASSSRRTTVANAASLRAHATPAVISRANAGRSDSRGPVRRTPVNRPLVLTDREKLAAVQKKFDALSAEAETLRLDNETLRLDNETLRLDNETLVSDANAAREQYENQLVEVKRTHLQERDQLSQLLSKEQAELKEYKSKLDTAEQRNKAYVTEIEQLQADVEHLTEEVEKRECHVRRLHDSVVDLKGKVRVMIRTRDGVDDASHLSYPCQESIRIQTDKGTQLTTKVARVFKPREKQEAVFNGVSELLLSVLYGQNVTIFAYGQTGSGKTYTMRGGEGEGAGIIPRAVGFLKDKMRSLEKIGWKFEFHASFLEVYNEEVYDLLADNRPRLSVQMADKVRVTGLSQHLVRDNDDVEVLLARADLTRRTAATKCNVQSSRSHAVFTLRVEGTNERTGETTAAVLNLADLAGSERLKESGAEGERFEELKSINHTLSTLQMCIRAQLTKQQHVPYRSSKLTSLLSDSLGGGKSKTMIIVTLNPSPVASVATETKRSIEFAGQLANTNGGPQKSAK